MLVKASKAALPKLLEDGVEGLQRLLAQIIDHNRPNGHASNGEEDIREILKIVRNDFQENTNASRRSKRS